MGWGILRKEVLESKKGKGKGEDFMRQASEWREWCVVRSKRLGRRGTMERASLQDFVEC